MSTIRLVINSELRSVLDFLRSSAYPTLTDAELVKVAISREAVRTKKTSTYDDSDPSLKELLFNSAKSWEMEEEEGEPFWDQKAIKPFKPMNHV